MRIEGVRRGMPLQLIVDGEAVPAFAGESVAAALLAAGRRQLRLSPVNAAPRGPFCWMGLCQECVVVIDGRRRPACRVAVADGMIVGSGRQS